MHRRFEETIREYLSVGRYTRPVEWCTGNIDFSLDHSSSKRKLDFSYSPFLIDPIATWDFDGVKREVVVVGPEQTGKTLTWIAPYMWSFIHKPCLSLVVYKSDDFAAKMNDDKMKPLMKMIPSLANELRLPRSNKKDCYNFSNLKSYFMGSGSRITSMSAKIVVFDEEDDYIEHEGQVSTLDDARKRLRSHNESLLYRVCTPKAGGTLNSSQIWEGFLNGSQGYWTLYCLKCGENTMRSCDTHNLQFESKDYNVVPGSCRLVCPKCGYSHTEDKKEKLNRLGLGKYIHKYEDRINERPSFQWGALASQAPDFAWDKIAQAQLDAGSTGSLKKQILFDNSYRGLPFRERRRDEKRETSLKRHCIAIPDAKDIRYCLISIDTQDMSWWYVVRGYDANNNSYKLDSGEVEHEYQLAALWDKEYLGKKCISGIIDSGGTRTREVGEFVAPRQGMFMYKGRGQLAMRRWEFSKESKNRLVLANPHIYKAELLYTIYSLEDKGRHYWYLPPESDLSADYIEQMLDHKPDNKKRDGNKYANWISTGKDHLFDCEKQLLVLHEICLKISQKK